ncbi:MAG: hypothetical protein IT423_08035 [Pirellulaceae bacterium]|nr:hypothetical protein [Pirellulaceae bacterium]
MPKISSITTRCMATAMFLASWSLAVPVGRASELYVGATTVSITPDLPVALSGQMYLRISQKVESPVTATALAIETRQGNESLEQAIMVSCDLVAIREGVLEKVRERLKPKLPGFDVNKLFLSATHTHTAPEMTEGRYDLPKDGVMQPAAYVEFLADQVATAAANAWNTRAVGGVGWGLGHAVVAHNRRVLYDGDRAQMYGNSNQATFRGIEGYEDHGVEVLFFWDAEGQLVATAINVACPSQEVESRSAVNADFWHEVREKLREKQGEKLHILGWTGAAGDQSPRPMYRKLAEDRMRELRGLTKLEEHARRIVQAWEEAYEGAKQEIHRDVPFTHLVKQIELPRRIVTHEESLAAQIKADELSKDPTQSPRMRWHLKVVERFKRQQAGEELPYDMELHAIRLGDIAIATNPFELFTDYGVRIKARCPALQTFVIQLAGPGSYLPSERAVRGGSYSAIVESSQVGPDGGQVLVDKTIEYLTSLWKEAAR